MTQLILLFILATLYMNAQSEKEECALLINEALPFAEKMLEEYAEFHPFGYALTPDSEIISLSGDSGEDYPKGTDLVEILSNHFKESAIIGKYTATAIVYNVNVQMPNTSKHSDAIAISLDHKNKYSVIVFYPYEIKNKKIIYGQKFAQTGAHKIFK